MPVCNFRELNRGLGRDADLAAFVANKALPEFPRVGFRLCLMVPGARM